ncbi:hypothetical protein [Phenylobacterium sp.]|uniref:hypothetical protein n=1 Tax=Phenylobacterium sp. TaxID=1871053 RepID=UPI00374C8F91
MATRPGRDFGGVRRFGLAHVIGAVVVLTVAIGALAFEYVRDRNASVATAQAWDIKGPPCPTLTEADFTAKHLLAPRTFNYDGAALGRWSGDASCSDVKASGGKGLTTDRICQFANPTVLTVVTPAGRWFYNIGVAQPATVSIHRDVARCVLAGKFTLQSE